MPALAGLKKLKPFWGVGYGLRRMRETGASRPERDVVGSLPFLVAVVDRNLKAKKLLS